MVQRIYTIVLPLTIQKLGNDSYLYNYDIQVLDKEFLEIDGTSKILPEYNFILVILRGQPNYKDCAKAIIGKYVTINEELDLVNSYNSYKSGKSSDLSSETEYLDYLTLLEEIKSKVKADFA